MLVRAVQCRAWMGWADLGFETQPWTAFTESVGCRVGNGMGRLSWSRALGSAVLVLGLELTKSKSAFQLFKKKFRYFILPTNLITPLLIVSLRLLGANHGPIV